MALFGRNPNEVAYTGGKKHWADVIKNSGPGELLIWRQPEEDFNTNSTLIVMPGEKAIFIKGGNVEQVFENGTYKLSTENYPFISRLRNVLTGGISTFNCVVYFVRDAHSEEIPWGTTSPIQVRDKVLGIATKLRCRGAFRIKIDNPVMFLEKLVGNNVPFESQMEINKYIRAEFQTKIRSIIGRALNETETELLGLDARLDEFSQMIEPYTQDILSEYGVKCVRFVVEAIDIDDDELRRRYDEIGMNQIEKLAEARSDLGVMNILGDNWGRQQSANILSELAKNPGAGGVGAMGAGMGMGMAAGNVFGNMANAMFEPMNKTAAPQPQMPGSNMDRFVQKSEESSSSSEDPVEVLAKLKKMLDMNLISQEEYEQKKNEILSKM